VAVFLATFALLFLLPRSARTAASGDMSPDPRSEFDSRTPHHAPAQ
jgi:hypothetical protein